MLDNTKRKDGRILKQSTHPSVLALCILCLYVLCIVSLRCAFYVILKPNLLPLCLLSQYSSVLMYTLCVLFLCTWILCYLSILHCLDFLCFMSIFFCHHAVCLNFLYQNTRVLTLCVLCPYVVCLSRFMLKFNVLTL